ncbi:hypothetical protein HDU81_000562, partial [Chytriomyces hyalinus]
FLKFLKLACFHHEIHFDKLADNMDPGLRIVYIISNASCAIYKLVHEIFKASQVLQGNMQDPNGD